MWLPRRLWGLLTGRRAVIARPDETMGCSRAMWCHGGPQGFPSASQRSWMASSRFLETETGGSDERARASVQRRKTETLNPKP